MSARCWPTGSTESSGEMPLIQGLSWSADLGLGDFDLSHKG